MSKHLDRLNIQRERVLELAAALTVGAGEQEVRSFRHELLAYWEIADEFRENLGAPYETIQAIASRYASGAQYLEPGDVQAEMLDVSSAITTLTRLQADLHKLHDDIRQEDRRWFFWHDEVPVFGLFALNAALFTIHAIDFGILALLT